MKVHGIKSVNDDGKKGKGYINDLKTRNIKEILTTPVSLDSYVLKST